MIKKAVLTLALIIVGASLLSLKAKEKRVFTLDDLYSLKSLSSLTLSPDGDYIAFTVSEANYKKGKSYSHIFLFNMEKHKLKQMTRGKVKDFSPQFSPDGKFIYFLSTREKGVQVWRIPIDGGESEQITDFSMGIEQFKVVDGEKIIFSTHVFPECLADSKKNKEFAEKMKKNPVQAHYANSLLFRHWTSYRDFKYSHLIEFDLKNKTYRAITEGTYDYPAY